MFDFIKDRIRYNRNEDKEIEEYWDMMLGGNAVKYDHNPANKFKNFVLNIVAIAVAFFGIMTISFSTSNGWAILGVLAAVIILPMISNAIFLNVIKKAWLKYLLCFVVAYVIGLILGLIGLAF